MERDTRRNRGQWRGCHAFKDIILDGDSRSTPKRDGGLKMGQTYYYYVCSLRCLCFLPLSLHLRHHRTKELLTDTRLQYEVDGSIETHDPSLPSTTTCPYLPGQTVNTVWVPVEQTLRKRSASLTSVRDADFKTMNPNDKFTTPRAAPSPPATPGLARLPTAPTMLQHKRSARSLSPSPNWMFSPRKLFSRKSSSSSLREVRSPTFPGEEPRSCSRASSSRSRDMSPESLRRFLVDDYEDEIDVAERPSIAIPEDIAEEFEDDDNFATSAASETQPVTVLSPPPMQRALSSHSQSSAATELARDRAGTPSLALQIPTAPTRTPPSVPFPEVETACYQSRFSIDSSVCSEDDAPRSPDSPSLPSFYHSESEEEDTLSANDDATPSLPPPAIHAQTHPAIARNLEATLSTYSLPKSTADEGKSTANTRPSLETFGSPALLARNGTDVPLGNTSLLTSPIPDSGLEELVNELSWMADIISGKAI